MPIANLLIPFLLLASHAAWAASNENSDPTPRKGIDPADAAKVKQFEAKRWLGIGAGGGTNGATTANPQAIQQATAGGIPGRRSCVTQIGPSTPANVGPGGQPTTTPRFGQANSSPVIVTGSVINVCR